ncbi:hypothetical protein PO124_07835 [Bacillus licheniformis]|nr:hypothetical protein [Bacillus licheniformis]
MIQASMAFCFRDKWRISFILARGKLQIAETVVKAVNKRVPVSSEQVKQY